MRLIFTIVLVFCSFFCIGQENDSLYLLSIGELLGIKVGIGSRGEAQPQFTKLVSVDVISGDELTSTGSNDLGMALHRLIPYSQYFQPSLMDGADHIFPFSLRGFSADQLLILINGKRLNQTAMLFENSRINKGAAAIDLRMIPLNAVDRVEILKEGASAQYGSDAIAGIINIILKEDASISASLAHAITYQGDGQAKEILTSFGRKYEKGQFQLFANFLEHEYFNRAGPDERLQYFEGDSRNTNKQPINHRYGTAASNNLNLTGTGNIQLDDNTSFYTSLIFNQRIGESAGYFRRPLDSRNVRAIYPDGFLPLICPTINSFSGDIGVKSIINDWNVDFSILFNLNIMDFYVNNSLNTSMGIKSPSSFYCGTLQLDEKVSNLDFSKAIDIGTKSPLVFSIGSELKTETYQVLKGDENSYKDGGEVVLDGPNAGASTTPGAQVLPGFSPGNEIKRNRQSAAFYLDAENQIVSKLTIGLAARAEQYSDFGTAFNGKFSIRVEPFKILALRGSASSGFRAPSLAQSYYSSTVTNFIDGVPYENGTFNVEHPISKILGASSLKPEKSFHYTAGFILLPKEKIAISADWYQVFVDSRIFFSGNFTATNSPAFATLFESYGVGGARFFTNAVNTITQGVDFTVKYATNLSKNRTFSAALTANYNTIRLNGEPNVPSQITQYTDVFFDRGERARITTSLPEGRVIARIQLKSKSYALTISGLYFSPITVVHSVSKPETDQRISQGTIADINLRYSFSNNFEVNFGGSNILNRYPDKSKTIEGDAFTGKIFPYTPFSSYGFSGGRVYISLRYVFSN